MSGLDFAILSARAERYAVVPTLVFRLRISEPSGTPIQAVALRTQIMIEPRKRRHGPDEEPRLLELFGEPKRWGETVKPFLWTHVATMVPGFEFSTEVDLPVTCTYDFEVTAAKYLSALEDGNVPLLFQFSGTVFTRSESGFSIAPVSWEKEATFSMPVATWREVMDKYFPGAAWLRLSRETFDRLRNFKAERALMTWDDAVEALLAAVPEKAPV